MRCITYFFRINYAVIPELMVQKSSTLQQKESGKKSDEKVTEASEKVTEK